MSFLTKKDFLDKERKQTNCLKPKLVSLFFSSNYFFDIFYSFFFSNTFLVLIHPLP